MRFGILSPRRDRQGGSRKLRKCLREGRGISGVHLGVSYNQADRPFGLTPGIPLPGPHTWSIRFFSLSSISSWTSTLITCLHIPISILIISPILLLILIIVHTRELGGREVGRIMRDLYHELRADAHWTALLFRQGRMRSDCSLWKKGGRSYGVRKIVHAGLCLGGENSRFLSWTRLTALGRRGRHQTWTGRRVYVEGYSRYRTGDRGRCG